MSTAHLSPKHRRMLEIESGISPEVYEESGVQSVAHGRELPSGFSRRQRGRGSGILFAVPRPNGETTWSYRPDAVDPENPGHKYEQPCKKLGAPGNVLYLHPSTRHLIEDTRVPVIFVEGVKKALSLVTAAQVAGVEVLVVAISGVWNWLSNGKPIEDMLGIPVDGREVYICFDSDVFSNPDVGDAARRLAAHLIGREARVWVAYLPDQADGSKTGADDYLASGHTYADLMALMHPFDSEDLARMRLRRDERLRAAVEYLWRRWREEDWMRFVGNADKGNWARGHTARDTKEALLELAERIGEVDEHGIVVEVGLRRLAEMAAKTAPSVGSAVKHLEADGQLEILPPKDKARARRYRLLVDSAALYSMESTITEEGLASVGTPRCKGLRAPSAPRLMWSSPARRGRLIRHFEGETGRTVTDAVGARPGVRRLGPHKCAVIDVLESADGEEGVGELMGSLHRTPSRERDFRRRILKPLEEAGIIEIAGGVVRLARGWREALEAERRDKGEIEQAERQKARHREESAARRKRLEAAKLGATKASLAAVRRAKALRHKRLREIREEDKRDRAPTPPAVEALIARIMCKHDRMRVGLLCELADEEGLRGRDVPIAVRRMGYSVERLPEFGDEEFVFARQAA